MREYEYRFKHVDSQRELDILQLNLISRIKHIKPLACLICVLNLLINKSLDLAFPPYRLQLFYLFIALFTVFYY